MRFKPLNLTTPLRCRLSWRRLTLQIICLGFEKFDGGSVYSIAGLIPHVNFHEVNYDALTNPRPKWSNLYYTLRISHPTFDYCGRNSPIFTGREKWKN